MKPWERGILEYRPVLGLTPEILTKVLSKPEGSPATFTPTPLAIESTQVLGSDLIENTMASLSRATDMVSTLNRCQSGTPSYAAYRTAKDGGDEDEARRIHLENIQDIGGNPQLDAVPILEACIDEMESFLEYINQNIFDGKADYSDMDRVRESEEKMVNTIFAQESMGKKVDYESLMLRVHMLAACSERMQTHQHTVDSAETYLNLGTKDAISSDAEGLLYYLADKPEPLIRTMQDAIEVGFNAPATMAVEQIVGAERSTDREFRDSLDTELSALKNKYTQVYSPLIPLFADDTMDMGVSALTSTIYEGMETISSAFKALTADHMATSFLTRTQTQNLFAYLSSKKLTQLMHQLLSTFVNEFDPVNLDREVKRFISQNKLDREGSLCG